MAIHDQIAPDEWQLVCAAPWAVGLYIATAVGGKVQEVREMLVLGGALHRALDRDHTGDLVGAVAAAFLSNATPPTGLVPERRSLLQTVAKASAIVEALPQGAIYCRWLWEIAQEVAAAEEDGGFLGIGGTEIHTAEQSALGEIAAVLKV